RVVKTRNALYDALVALILRQDYESITVQTILAEADVGRSTFYAHFTSKDDLLASSLDRLGDLLRQATASDADGQSWSLVLFSHVAEYKDVYFALAGAEASNVLQGAIRSVVTDFVRATVPPAEGIPAELACSHVAGTFMTVIAWWLDRKRTLQPAEVDRLFLRLLTV
ncbi:MAG TPA: TetR/AcrR family transcriptional regulator, partial [Devosia sp.]|nr:TetR/AcrR family transcriptional regulator [Devosia sp.]